MPNLKVADVDFNAAAINRVISEAAKRDVQVLAFPEMSITSYTLGDLVYHEALLTKALHGLESILIETKNSGRAMLVVVGIPLVAEQKIFNCAVVINSGQILGIVPKTNIPTYREFYEGRWWSPSYNIRQPTIDLLGQSLPFGADLLFRLNNSDAIVGIEICEDLWLPLAPHESQALAGATILLNISASNEVLGKKSWRKTMIISESGRCSAAYGYTSAGIGESSNDLVFSGHAIIAENGVVMAESKNLPREPHLLISDIDIGRLAYDRRSNSSFRSVSARVAPYRIFDTQVDDPSPVKLERDIDPHPFVPSDPGQRGDRCREIFSMQVAALAQKMQGAKKEKLVLGISGGLDSTLALLVAAKTMDFLKLPRKYVYAFSLPGFGTTSRTKRNATSLAENLGVSLGKVGIGRSSQAHLRDLEHLSDSDVVFENVQARYRTDFLFNKANQIGGLLLGTGDLTEVALGWATFSGDHMSHYHINASVPKTLVRYLVRWVAEEEMADTTVFQVLNDILATPISPELIRPKNGEIVQKSEDIIGPVELADFFLYPFVRFGTPPGKILFLAYEAAKRGLFDRPYSLEELKKWLVSFIQRFFDNQFKRTCMPEGPKVGSVSLSPRGDWRMASEAEAKLWLEDVELMYRHLR